MLLEVKNSFIVMGTGAEVKPRKNRDGSPKLSPMGLPTFSLGGITLRENGGVDRSVFVHSCQETKLKMGERFKTAGRCWVLPFASNNNGFVNLSVVCERLEPVTESAGLSPRPKREDA